MHWESPEYLWALWLLPILAAAMVFDYLARRRLVQRFVGSWLEPRLAARRRFGWLLVRAVCLLLGLGLLMTALARPRFGKSEEMVTSRGFDLVILLDVSRSMLAEDVAPNRLQRAVSDIRDLLPKLQGDRVALVVFAGSPIVRVPLTTDQAFVRQTLDAVSADAIAKGGSAIGDAIRKGLDLLPPTTSRDQAMLLITDGEDHDSFPQEAAEQAAERNVKLFAVGLGDAEQGGRIPIRDESGNLTYLRFEGREVWSKVDRDLLTDLALKTGGAYVPAHTRNYDLGGVYESYLKDLTRGELQSDRVTRYRQRFPLFLGLGLALLLLERVLPSYSRLDPREPAAPSSTAPSSMAEAS